MKTQPANLAPPVIILALPVFNLEGAPIIISGPVIIFPERLRAMWRPVVAFREGVGAASGRLRQSVEAASLKVGMGRTFCRLLSPLPRRPPQRCHGGALRPPACLGARACLRRLRHNRSGWVGMARTFCPKPVPIAFRGTFVSPLLSIAAIEFQERHGTPSIRKSHLV